MVVSASPIRVLPGNKKFVHTNTNNEVRNMLGQPHCQIEAIHFFQEDQPERLVHLILNFIDSLET
jgi:hypothetical protein